MAWRENKGTGLDTAGSIEALRGHGLRFVLVDAIRSRRIMSVAEMVAYVAEAGFEIDGRHSKVISDALRWEVGKGRVRRLRRGVYAYGRAPTTTARRIRLFARRCHAWIEAKLRHEIPPPTPSIPAARRNPYRPWSDDPTRSPWGDLRWLWSL